MLQDVRMERLALSVAVVAVEKVAAIFDKQADVRIAERRSGAARVARHTLRLAAPQPLRPPLIGLATACQPFVHSRRLGLAEYSA